MHEASLMKNLMRQIDEIAKAEEAKQVTGLAVWIGALAHMSADHFVEHFEESSAGTVAAGAELEITVSEDINDANADKILIQSISVDT